VCVQLHHPSLIQAEIWVVEAGVEAELLAREKPQLRGRVVHEGAPVGAARIRVSESEKDPTAMPAFAQRSTSSDLDGRFRLSRVDLPPCDPCAEQRGQCSVGEARKDVLYRGALTLTAIAKGYTTAILEFDDLPEGEVLVELERPSVATRGRIVGADGEFFPRADVVFRSDDRPQELHRTHLVDGAFEVYELARGSYTMRVLQDGVSLLELPGVTAGAELDLRSEFDARGATLRVRVVDQGGEAAGGVRLEGGAFVRGTQTDEAGEVVAHDMLAGHYRARLWVQGGTPKQVSFDLESEAIAEAKASISGEVELQFSYELPQSARE
jgi:hypothetical protein